jgi:hypothetical protein
MSAIHNQAFNYLDAKDRMKQAEDKARTSAILRAMNAENEEMQALRLKLAVSRVTLLLAIAANFYAAAKGWGVL